MYVGEYADGGEGFAAGDRLALQPVRSSEDGGIRRGEGLLPPFEPI